MLKQIQYISKNSLLESELFPRLVRIVCFLVMPFRQYKTIIMTMTVMVIAIIPKIKKPLIVDFSPLTGQPVEVKYKSTNPQLY